MIKKEEIVDDEFNLICEFIKLRNESKLSQRDITKLTGVAQSTIARMEKSIHSASLSTFIKILSAMNYKLEIIKKEE